MRLFPVLTLLAASLLACALGEKEGTNAGECADDADNDGDGAFDCDDTDCAGSDPCAEATGDSSAPIDEGPDCAPEAEGDPWEVGSIAPDFALKDQDGETVHLYDFCDRAIWLDFDAMWNGAAEAQMLDMEAMQQAYENDGFTSIVVLIGNTEDADTSAAERSDWADTYDLTFPVLGDLVYGTFTVWKDPGDEAIGLPYNFLLGPGAEVAVVNEKVTASDVQKVLP